MTTHDTAALILRHDAAWNTHDLDAICACYHPEIVFHNLSADEEAVGLEAVRAHIGRILENWPDLHFTSRRRYHAETFSVSEWTATATHADGRHLEWDGIDVFPLVDGLIARKDVYSSAHRARVVVAP